MDETDSLLRSDPALGCLVRHVDFYQARHDDPALRIEVGARGKMFIEEHFSNDNFKKSVDAFLDGKEA